MRRRLFTIASAISLLFCVGTVALGMRSYFVSDRLFSSSFTNEQEWTFWRQTSLQTGLGGIGISSHVSSGPRDSYKAHIESTYKKYNLGEVKPLKYRSATAEYPTAPPFVNSILGFKWGRFATGQAGRRPATYGFQLAAPLWFLTLIFLLLPTTWASRWHRQRKCRRQNLCRACSYNLTGNVSGVCPECGATIQSEPVPEKIA